MFIDGLVSSVGPVYAGYMQRTLPVWASTLDSLTVVTMPGDPVVEACRPYTRVRVVETDVFKRHGAAFNKGAALSQAYAVMDPIDAVLHFDADILPPDGWREVAEREFVPGCIHGAVRLDEAGGKISDLGDWPYGYFQLWRADDPACQYWPLFEVWHPSAGGYDLEFLEHWPRRLRKRLSFDVVHFGEVRRNWFGVGLPQEEQREAFRRMDQVHRVGLRETRLRTRRPENRLKVPEFALRLTLKADPKKPGRLRELVRSCMTDDPFLVEASAVAALTLVSSARRGRRKPSLGMAPSDVRELVVEAYRRRHDRNP